MFSECVKPLIQEVKLKDEIIERWNSAKRGANEDLKMLNSIIRIPRLCVEFQKACKKKMTNDAIRKRQEEAYEHISNRMDGKSEDVFIESFIDRID